MKPEARLLRQTRASMFYFKSALGLSFIGQFNHINTRRLVLIKTLVDRRQLLGFYRELGQSTEQRVEPESRLQWRRQSDQRQQG